MATHDLPTSLNYVLSVTKQGMFNKSKLIQTKKENNGLIATLAYIGHSQGTAIMFALLSLRPEWSEKIKPFIALAPVAHVFRVSLFLKLCSPINRIVIRPFKFMGQIRRLDLICNSFTSTLLLYVVSYITGFDCHVNKDRLPVHLASLFESTSFWNILHYAQNVYLDKFEAFDNGLKYNLLHYGTPLPPKYQLEKINSSDIFLYYTDNDALSTPHDVNTLKKRLKG